MRDLGAGIDAGGSMTVGSAGAALLSARGLGLTLGGRAAIDGIDLDIAPHGQTVIMGANGAGKSLLLRLLHGLLLPTAGTLLWQGQPAGAKARQSQAMVFQRPVLLRRSVLANIHFALRARGFRGAERSARAEAALASARLTEFAHRPARGLSGGEQQRLAVAQALATDPTVLFLDEPTASLDPASTHAIEDLLRDAAARGIAIVLVTHDVGQARRIGGTLAFLHRGRLVESGPVADVLDAPRSAPAQAWVDGRLYLDP